MIAVLINLKDLVFTTENQGGVYTLGLPSDPTLAKLAVTLMRVLIQVQPTGKEAQQDLERSGDVLKDLELEMANDKVGNNVAMMHDMQDMVAMRVLDPFMEGSETTQATADDLVELSFWFNRRRHALRSYTQNESVETLGLVCLLWSTQTLEVAED